MTKIKMEMKLKKRNKQESILDGIIMELHEIKSHIANKRSFEAYVGLRGLLNTLCYQIEKIRGHDEEVQSEESYEECEESPKEENFDWKAAYYTVEIDNCELRKNLREANFEIDLVKDLIKILIKEDHIFPGKIDQIIKKLALCNSDWNFYLTFVRKESIEEDQ